MQLKPFKEKNPKKVGIILFTISCILLISGVILYRTFAIFQVNENQNMIEGTVQDMGDVEFAFYQEIDGKDTIVTNAPTKDSGYSLDTSSSYCVDMETGNHISNITWDDERWGPFLANVSKTKTKCYLHFKQIYKDGTLNGAIPDLMNGRLVPIKISDTEKPSDIDYVGAQAGKVTKADITSEWYNYSKQQWANAVILKDGKTDTYKAGDEIKESDIESYFVWIPRYRYKLKENESTYDSFNDKTTTEKFQSGTKNAFEIEFETKDKGIEKGNTKDMYITHPAFISFNSNGMWVGKFETGYKDATDKTMAEKNERKIESIIIKPNSYSWRNIAISNAFYNSYNYLRDFESHMMKSMEWGAVLYLTQSKYGRCNENNCEEVKMNNNSNYITGFSSKEDSNTFNSNVTDSAPLNSDGDHGYSYYNLNSNKSSTTGNYYGIYDMAGGAWEYVMGIMQSSATNGSPASGQSAKYNSGFIGEYSCPSCASSQETELVNGQTWPSSKYYDLYDYSTNNFEYKRGKIGDGTKELGPFCSDSGNCTINFLTNKAELINNARPWISRGSANGIISAGIFSFSCGGGNNDPKYTFRIILTP